MFRRILSKADRIKHLAIIILIWSQSAQSNQLSSQIIDMDQSSWKTEGNVFVCRLTQPINNGFIEFIARAGHPLSVSLYNGDKSDIGELTLLQVPPPWKKDIQTVEQGKGYISPESPYQSNGTEGLLRGLTWGHWGKLILDTPLGQKTVTISNTGIYKPALNFQACRNKLLPASFDQVRLVRIQFSSGKARPQPRYADELNNLATYVHADEEIEEIHIDGHSDSAGQHLDNLQIAKDRADSVASYLKHLGISEDKIKTRFHAERYPIATNNTAAGRAQNRRVDVRLIRKNTPPDPETFFSN